MVRNFLTSEGVAKLCIVLRKINSEVYVDILEHYLMPSIEEVFGDFSDRSKLVKDFLNQNENSPIKIMNWHANSPGLNQIENVWNA